MKQQDHLLCGLANHTVHRGLMHLAPSCCLLIGVTSTAQAVITCTVSELSATHYGQGVFLQRPLSLRLKEQRPNSIASKKHYEQLALATSWCKRCVA